MSTIDQASDLADGDEAREAAVVTKAAARVATKLDLSNRLVADIIGLSEPSVSRLKRAQYVIPARSKPFELAVLLIRLFRSLHAIVAGDEVSAQSWLRGYNNALCGRPIDLIQSVTGLTSVVAYLDARRALI